MRTDNVPDSVRQCSNAIHQNLVNVLTAVLHAAVDRATQGNSMRHGTRGIAMRFMSYE
jgi:hypothetical protein